MALTQSSVTLSAPQPTSQQLNLPPPQTFDILPALHELLARIDHSATDPTTSLDDQAPNDSEDIGALYSPLQPLEPKELPTEVLEIKRKIRKALKELERLPDMERSIDEQQEEIDALEGRIKRQGEMIARLAELAKGMRDRVG